MSDKIIKHTCPIRRAGSGPEHHFFGYYNKSTWDRSDRYLLANQVPMMDANIRADLKAEIGFFDLHNNDAFTVVDTTTTWNWQMGCQSQWLDGREGHQIIYNVRTKNTDCPYPEFGSRIYNIDTQQTQDFDLPIYVVSPDSKFAISLDYRRLWITHETIGYCDTEPQPSLPLAPDNDGLRHLDLDTGEHKLVISYADLKNFHYCDSMEKALHWVSHIEVNTNSSRILFLHRWTERVLDETCFLHRLITMNPDGSDMRLLECSDHPLPQLAEDFDPAAVGTFDYEKSEYQISHPLWCDDKRIIVWGPHNGSIHYHLYTDAENGEVGIIGESILTENGHMTFSPVNKRWLLSDTYPDSETNQRILFLYDMEKNLRYDLGSFYTDPNLRKENRCDLHPRWSRDGQQVCIDSVHENIRQMYIIDVSSLVG